MANELARIGFAADTQPLVDAKQKLEAIVPAAQKAAGGAERFKAAATGMASAASSAAATGFPKLDAAMRSAAQGSVAFGSAANAAASGASALNRAAMTSTSALGTVQQAAVAATGAVRVAGQAAQQYGPPTSAWQVYQQQLNKVPAAAGNATSSLNRLGAAANDNINRLQSTPGNIAAQFQDIGVTAAGGMQPYLIALQQGTQLGAAMQGGLRSLVAGFAQLFNPISLAAIALTALIAYGIQWAMSALDSSKATDELADSLAKGAQNADFFGKAQTLIGTVFDTTTGKLKNHNSVLAQYIKLQAQANIVAAQAARQKAGEALGDLTKASAKEFASDAFSAFKEGGAAYGLPLLFGKALGRGKAMAPLQGALSDFASTVNGTTLTVDGLNKATDATIARLDKLSKGGKIAGRDLIKVKQAVLDLAVARGQEFANTDVVGSLNSGKLAPSLYAYQRDKKPKKPKHDPWSDIVERGQNDIATENARMEAMQLTGAAAAELEQKQKLLNAANSAGIKLTEQQRQKIDELAAAYGKAKYAADVAEFMKNARESSVLDLERIRMATQDVGLYGREAEYASKMSDLVLSASKQKIEVTREMLTEFKRIAGEYADAAQGLARDKFMEQLRLDAEQTTFALQREAGAVGLTSVALDQYNYVTERLIAAKRAHIELTPAEIASIEAAGAAYASQRDMIDQNRAALDLAKDSARGFISDLKSGLDEGKGIFKSFTDSVLGMLDKVISKLMDVTLNAAFDGNTKGSMGFISALGSLFGGGNSSALGASVRSSANASLNAIPHAKGAVITGPAMFAASGGAHQMGEAGPEGILPLKRGSDGSLGVQMHGGRGAQQAPSVSVTNHYHIEGAIDGGTIAAQIRQSAETTAADVRRSIPSVLAEYQSTGTVAA